MPDETDFLGILRELTARGVDYVVIGGIAAVLHGSPRVTQDLDICFATDGGNLTALGQALIALEARLADIDEDVPFVPDAAALRRMLLLTLETAKGRLDLLAAPDGFPGFEPLRQEAERFEIDGFFVLVASLDHLIAMKRAAGRPKDLADIVELEAIRERRR